MPLNRLKLRHLRFVRTLADTGSLQRTADALSITYAAVAKMRAELEEVLGIELLEGRGRRIGLTPAGALIAASARRVFAELESLRDELLSLEDGLAGTVVVGVRTVSMRGALADAVGAFKRSHPRVVLRLVEGTLSHLLDELGEHRIDVVVGRLNRATLPPTLTGVPIGYPSSVVVCSVGHPARALAADDWAGLVRFAWCLPPAGSPLRGAFDRDLALRGLRFPVDVVEVGDAALIGAMLQTGPLLAIMPQAIADELRRRGEVEVLDAVAPRLADPIGLIWRNDPATRGAVRHCIDFLAERLTFVGTD